MKCLSFEFIHIDQMFIQYHFVFSLERINYIAFILFFKRCIKNKNEFF